MPYETDHYKAQSKRLLGECGSVTRLAREVKDPVLFEVAECARDQLMYAMPKTFHDEEQVLKEVAASIAFVRDRLSNH